MGRWAPALLAVIVLERGERRAAQELAERAARTRRELGVQCLPQGAYSWWATSYVHLASGRLPEAARDAGIGVTVTAEIARGLDSAFLRVPCRIQLASVRIAEGDRDGAQVLLREVRDELADAPDAGRMVSWLDEVSSAMRLHAPAS